MARFLLIPLAVAALLFAAACGDDDEGPGDAGNGSTAQATTPAAAAATPTPKPDPCALLNADQVKDAIGASPAGSAADVPEGSSCAWTDGTKSLLVTIRDGANAKKDFEAAAASSAPIQNFVSRGQQLPAHRSDAEGKTTVRVLRGERLVVVELTSAEDISRLVKARTLAQIVLGQ